MDPVFRILIISDGIGETAEVATRAIVEQFTAVTWEIVKYPYCVDPEAVARIIDNAQEGDTAVVFTTVLPRLRARIVEVCQTRHIPCVDLLGGLLTTLRELSGIEPLGEPGLIHRLNQRYYDRVEAVEFAVKYDDAKDPRGLVLADLVLVGISRTSKTPLSMYLAHKNLKVANVPLVPEVPLPPELLSLPAGRVIGLTADPGRLNEVRRERLQTLGLGGQARYSSLDRIVEELEYADRVFKRLNCPVIDITRKAVEETASLIVEMLRQQEKAR